MEFNRNVPIMPRIFFLSAVFLICVCCKKILCPKMHTDMKQSPLTNDGSSDFDIMNSAVPDYNNDISPSGFGSADIVSSCGVTDIGSSDYGNDG